MKQYLFGSLMFLILFFNSCEFDKQQLPPNNPTTSKYSEAYEISSKLVPFDYTNSKITDPFYADFTTGATYDIDDAVASVQNIQMGLQYDPVLDSFRLLDVLTLSSVNVFPLLWNQLSSYTTCNFQRLTGYSDYQFYSFKNQYEFMTGLGTSTSPPVNNKFTFKSLDPSKGPLFVKVLVYTPGPKPTIIFMGVLRIDRTENNEDFNYIHYSARFMKLN